MSIFKKILDKYRRSKMNPHQLAESFRPVLYHLGTNVSLYTTSLGTKPYLISIGNDVTIAANMTRKSLSSEDMAQQRQKYFFK